MVDHYLRAPKERLLAPVATRLGHLLHPTSLTLIAFGAGLGAAFSIWRAAYGLGLVCWLINRAIDGLDGSVARATGTQSDFGGYLDIVLDVTIYALLPIALVASLPSAQGHLSLAALLGSFYLNAISWAYLAAVLEKRAQGAVAQAELTTVTMPGGVIEGAETVLFFCLFLLFPGVYTHLFWLMSGLVLLTVAQRMIWAHYHLR